MCLHFLHREASESLQSFWFSTELLQIWKSNQCTTTSQRGLHVSTKKWKKVCISLTSRRNFSKGFVFRIFLSGCSFSWSQYEFVVTRWEQWVGAYDSQSGWKQGSDLPPMLNQQAAFVVSKPCYSCLGLLSAKQFSTFLVWSIWTALSVPGVTVSACCFVLSSQDKRQIRGSI